MCLKNPRIAFWPFEGFFFWPRHSRVALCSRLSRCLPVSLSKPESQFAGAAREPLKLARPRAEALLDRDTLPR